MAHKFRLDQRLTELNPQLTRSQSQLLIQEEKVTVNKKLITKSGHLVSESDLIEISDLSPYVSRGAYKIKAAIETFKLDPTNKVIADIGASTGGFTDYLLQNGAKKSYAIDVGHGQLSEQLKTDPRVVNLEGINIREGIQLSEKVDWVVMDLSFISLRLVMAEVRKLLKENGEVICLFKPQFEVGKERIKKGVVKNPTLRKRALDAFLEYCRKEKWKIKGVMESPVIGKEGNIEFLCWLGNNKTLGGNITPFG